MQCLPRYVLSPSAIAVQQLRNFRLLPSLHSETSKDSRVSNAGDAGGGKKSSYDMVIVGDGPVSAALACSVGEVLITK